MEKLMGDMSALQRKAEAAEELADAMKQETEKAQVGGRRPALELCRPCCVSLYRLRRWPCPPYPWVQPAHTGGSIPLAGCHSLVWGRAGVVALPPPPLHSAHARSICRRPQVQLREANEALMEGNLRATQIAQAAVARIEALKSELESVKASPGACAPTARARRMPLGPAWPLGRARCRTLLATPCWPMPCTVSFPGCAAP